MTLEKICPYCSCSIEKLQRYKYHVAGCKIMHRFLINKTQCSLCNKTSATRSGFYVHLKAKHPEILVENGKTCPICSKTMSLSYESRHIKLCEKLFHFVDNIENSFKCKLCTKVCGLQSGIYQHLKVCHGAEVGLNEKNPKVVKEFTKVKCENCADSFAQHKMKSHVKYCLIYSKFYTKEGGKYSCLKCDTFHSEIDKIRKHLNESHFKDVADQREELEQSEIHMDYDDNFTWPEQIKTEITEDFENELVSAGEIKTDTNKDIENALLTPEQIKTELEFSDDFENELLPSELVQTELSEDSENILKIKIPIKRKIKIPIQKGLKIPKLSKIAEILNEKSKIPCDQCGVKFTKRHMKNHTNKCHLYSKFIKHDGKTNHSICMICDVSFTLRGNLVVHLKSKHKEHLASEDFIEDSFNKTSVSLKSDQDGSTHLEPDITIETSNEHNDEFNPVEQTNTEDFIQEESTENTSYDHDLSTNLEQDKKIDSPNENDNKIEVIEESVNHEPKELTEVYKCQMCLRKYVSNRDVEMHIQLFHKISIKIQRKSMSGLIIKQIIKESVE